MSLDNGQERAERRSDRVDTLLAALQDMIVSLSGMSRQLQREIANWHAEHLAPQHGDPAVALLQTENVQLKQALEGRAVIERAKGILMATCGYDEDAAFQRLVEISRWERRKVRDVAASVVAGLPSAAAPARASSPASDAPSR